MEYYLAIKRNEILIHAIIYIKLKIILLSEKAKKVKSMESESVLVVSWGKKRDKLEINMRDLTGKMKIFLNWIMVKIIPLGKFTKSLEIVYLKKINAMVYKIIQ